MHTTYRCLGVLFFDITEGDVDREIGDFEGKG